MNLHLDALQKHLSGARHPTRPTMTRTIECRDGFRMSVQASEHHYCSPRTNEGPWDEVEVGFPSAVEPLLWKYADEPGNWTETVYGYVPIELVAAVVELHGGMKDA